MYTISYTFSSGLPVVQLKNAEQTVGTTASQAIDGSWVKGTSTKIDEFSTRPWWEAELATVSVVERVELYMDGTHEGLEVKIIPFFLR